MSATRRLRAAPSGFVGATSVVLRLLIVAGAALALGATWLAAGRAVPAAGVLVGLLTAVFALVPDSQLGLAVIVVLAGHWWVVVDDPTSPWVLVAGAGVALFHAAGAAATVGPPAAAWPADLRRRWMVRTGALAAVAGATWAVAAALEGRLTGGAAAVLVAALLAVGAGALWTREGRFGR